MVNVHTSVCPVSPGSHLVWSVPHISADITISILIGPATIRQNCVPRKRSHFPLTSTKKEFNSKNGKRKMLAA